MLSDRCPVCLSVTLVYCGQTVGRIKMKLGTQVGLGPVHNVLDGDPAPLRTKGLEPPPQFSAHFYCDQTAGCIKMPLGVEVGLSPGDFVVLDADPAPYPKRGGAHPIFCPRLLWPNCCMGEDATWYGSRPWPTQHWVGCGPSYPQKKGHTHPT